MALALETELCLIRETWLHFNLLIDFLRLSSARIVFKNVSIEGLVLQGAVVEFCKSTGEGENYVLRTSCCLISSTSGCIVEDRSILHLFGETILVTPRVS